VRRGRPMHGGVHGHGGGGWSSGEHGIGKANGQHRLVFRWHGCSMAAGGRAAGARTSNSSREMFLNAALAAASCADLDDAFSCFLRFNSSADPSASALSSYTSMMRVWSWVSSSDFVASVSSGSSTSTGSACSLPCRYR
jgi:hypothetical protein